MEEKLNIAEILKDTPTGTLLYSPIFGELAYIGSYADEGQTYSIIICQYPDAISGTIDAAIYYIDHDGIITFSTVDKETAKIIMDEYREIKLPEKWSYGDILINLKTKDFAVYRKDDDFRKESFRDEIYVKNDGIVIFRNYLHRNDDFSLATDEETQQFYELLHKQGKDWDVKNKQLVDWKWKPKDGEDYWTVIVGIENKLKLTWFGTKADEARYKLGNCFKTREEAEVMAEKVKNLFLQNYEKTKENS